MCKEISYREQQAALYKSQEASRHVQESAATIGPMGQIAVDHAQMMGVTGAAMESSTREAVAGAYTDRVQRALTRGKNKKGGSGEEAGADAVADAGGNVGGQAASVTSTSASSGFSMASMIPGPGMTELLINWGQFMQLFSQLLDDGARLLPDFDMGLSAAWTNDFQSFMGYFAIFNLDVDTSVCAAAISNRRPPRRSRADHPR